MLLVQFLHLLECPQSGVTRGTIRIRIVLPILHNYSSAPLSAPTKIVTGAAVETALLDVVLLHQLDVVPEIAIQHQAVSCLMDVGQTALMEARDYASPFLSTATCERRVHERAVGLLHATQQVVVDVVPAQHVRTERG